MQIGELAAATGLSRDTLRYYEKRGLIRAIRRPNGYRHYPEASVFLLNYVRTAQRLGFTLAEIEAELPELAGAGDDDARVAALLRSKIASIDSRIPEVQTLRDDLAQRLDMACPLVTEAQARTAI